MFHLTPTLLRRLLLWLATVVCVSIVGVLMQQAYAELREAQRRQVAFSQSSSYSAYQLEREYLQLTQQLDASIHSGKALDPAQSKRALNSLRAQHQGVSTAAVAANLRQTDEFKRVDSLLVLLLPRLEATFAQVTGSPADQAALWRELQNMAPAMSAMTLRASTLMTEEQQGLLNHQVEDALAKLGWMGALMVLLLASSFAIGARQTQVERERMRQELEHDRMLEAHAKADAANAGKTQFLANMSHELRTPLNGMLGMLSLLEATPVNAQQDDYIQTANRSAKHLLSLLNDILDASALEAGKMTLKPESTFLPALVTDVHALMRPVALEKRLVLNVRQDPALPRWVMADGTRVKQIMLNLVSNALKFSEQGTVLLEVWPLEPEPGAPATAARIGIRVTDEGMGMSAAVLAKLFQRFEQGDASSVRRHGGSGLGLEISRNLARRMDGDIEASSVEGKGSVFTATLCLPLSTPPTEQTSDAMVARREAGSPGLNLVVAEDNAINRKYMEALLRNMGHTVRFAEHGGLAIQEVQKELPDLVLMDLHMPEVDGLQATEAIRRLPAPYGSLPIIALTADVFEESKDRVHAAGMDGFLSKPVNVHELEKMLVRKFGLRGASQAAPVAPAPAKVAAPTPEAPPARQPRRRFRPGDVAEHLNMAMIGDLCVGVTLQGYQSLLDGAMRTDAHCYAEVLAALEAGETDKLLELGHSFKGVAASLGLAALSRMALTIEKQGHSFSADECHRQAESLRECWNTTYAICARMGLIVSS